ncbi:MAG: DUF2213 domain-containing protein [Campylobacteraceae bacterium]|jgi:hypothetical protein|nr:DUF2213 domain-containing protein [Campylobacteraceae bacterium]
MKVRLIDKLGDSLISARDGYQEYLGFEIGVEPSDKMYKIYRSPDEIRKMADALVGIPVVNGHESDVNWTDEKPIDPNIIVSKIISSEVKASKTNFQDSTVEIYNVIENNKVVEQLRKEKKELSIGYMSDLEPSTDQRYDFVQLNLKPRHLAIEAAGRCGICKFIDKEQKLNELTELINALDDEKKSKVKTFINKLQTNDDNEEEEKDLVIDSDLLKKIELLNNDKLQELSKIVDELLGSKKEDFKDSKTFKDAVMKFGNERFEAIEKIKKLDAKYQFADKTNCEIKRAVVEKAFPNKKFDDADILSLFKIADSVPSINVPIKDEGSEFDKLKSKVIGV